MKLKMSVASLIVLFTVTLIVYAPSLQMGFRFIDDYTYLDWAGTMPLAQYLDYSWNPLAQAFNYRPLRRMLILVELNLFHSDASYYHLVQVLIHMINALLVLLVVWRLTKRWHVAFLAAVFFAGFPIASEAVLWMTDESVLATLFSLLAVLFWIVYLQNENQRYMILALGALILAFLTKESSIAVPVAFFLIDRLLFRDPIGWLELLSRYLMVGIISLTYLGVEYLVQHQGLFVTIGGYSLGWHVFSNYAAYLAMLVFPWGLTHPSASDIVFWVSGLAFFGVAVFKYGIRLLFLVAMVILGIGPVVLAPLGPGARYLYLAVIPWATLNALAVEWIWKRWESIPIGASLSILLAGFLVINSSSVADLAADISEASRQARVPFRDIMRQHLTFSPDTRLFFIEPPNGQTTPEIAGMFMLQYNMPFSVGATYPDYRMYTGGLLRAERADLRKHAASYVYYFDETGKPIEVNVDRQEQTQASPNLPVSFQSPIRLEGYEITTSAIKRGQTLVLFLYWQATGEIANDYTVFVHLVDANGNTLVGEDGFPRSGKEKTSLWRADQFTADAHILSIPTDAPIGQNYYFEVGLYYLPTLERLSLVDPQGLVIGDKVVIGPVEIVE